MPVAASAPPRRGPRRGGGRSSSSGSATFSTRGQLGHQLAELQDQPDRGAAQPGALVGRAVVEAPTGEGHGAGVGRRGCRPGSAAARTCRCREGPVTATTSPGCDVEGRAAQRRGAAVAQVQPAGAGQGHRWSLHSRRGPPRRSATRSRDCSSHRRSASRWTMVWSRAMRVPTLLAASRCRVSSRSASMWAARWRTRKSSASRPACRAVTVLRTSSSAAYDAGCSTSASQARSSHLARGGQRVDGALGARALARWRRPRRSRRAAGGPGRRRPGRRPAVASRGTARRRRA